MDAITVNEDYSDDCSHLTNHLANLAEAKTNFHESLSSSLLAEIGYADEMSSLRSGGKSAN